MGGVFFGVSKNGQDPELRMDSIERDGRGKVAAQERYGAEGDGRNLQGDKDSATKIPCRNTGSIDQAPVRQAGLYVGQEEPVLPMARAAYEDILLHIASRPAESGGILLGPIGGNEITRFHFDHAGSCTSSSYSPDHIGLSQRMKQDWLPSGIDMKGFAHSHPGRLDWLTTGDLRYIRRLLTANDDMDVFVAPIVIPIEFRIRPIVVLRTDMSTARQAKLVLY